MNKRQRRAIQRADKRKAFQVWLAMIMPWRETSLTNLYLQGRPMIAYHCDVVDSQRKYAVFPTRTDYTRWAIHVSEPQRSSVFDPTYVYRDTAEEAMREAERMELEKRDAK